MTKSESQSTRIFFASFRIFSYFLGFWEVLEAETSGLGNGESLENHIVDIVVAVIGWWMVILWYMRDDIPWFSARSTCHNECEPTTWFDGYWLEDKNDHKPISSLDHVP